MDWNLSVVTKHQSDYSLRRLEWPYMKQYWREFISCRHMTPAKKRDSRAIGSFFCSCGAVRRGAARLGTAFFNISLVGADRLAHTSKRSFRSGEWEEQIENEYDAQGCCVVGLLRRWRFPSQFSSVGGRKDVNFSITSMTAEALCTCFWRL